MGDQPDRPPGLQQQRRRGGGQDDAHLLGRTLPAPDLHVPIEIEHQPDIAARLPVELDGVELVFKEAHLWGNRFLPPGLQVRPTGKGFCPFPWEMLTVHWNGDCSICCLDYNRDIFLGSVLESSIEDIYTGAKITEIRNSMAKGIVTVRRRLRP